MRTYGRITNEDGTQTWAEVSTDASGFNDGVWITTLAQCLLLNLGESPFFANYGIPAQQSIIQQVMPDFYIAQTQRQFAPYFASLIVAKVEGREPHYKVNVTTQQGVKITGSIPI